MTLVFKMLKRLNITYKRRYDVKFERNTVRTKDIRSTLIEKLISLRKEGKRFIYIDETGFNNLLLPIYGYYKKGHPWILKTHAQIKNLSVVAAITEDEILGFQIIRETTKGPDFAGFMSNLIINKKLREQGLDKFVFIMNNSQIHHATY